MPDLFHLLEDNFAAFFGFCVAWVVAWSGFFALRRYRAEPLYPRFADADVRFSENYASGFSHKNLFTRLGGARNALAVKVIKGAVLIEPIAIFKWIMPMGFNDLEHYVPHSNIMRVQPASSFGKETVQVEFRGKDGAPHLIELVLRDPKGFLAAVNA